MKMEGFLFLNLLSYSFNLLKNIFEEDVYIAVEVDEDTLSIYIYTSKNTKEAMDCLDKFDDIFYLDSDLYNLVDYHLMFKNSDGTIP